MAGKQILETERLLLREFDEGDAGPFYLLGSDPAIIRYTGDPGGGLKSVEQAREVLRARPMADYQRHGFGRWACVLRASGAVIGFAGLKYLDDVREVDLGYRLLPAYWGRGLATEACRAVVSHGFSRLGLTRIIGLVDPDNRASVRVLEKLGFAFVEMRDLWSQRLGWYVLEAGYRMVTVRPYRPDDAVALLALFRDTIRRVCARDYTPVQIAAWASEGIDSAEWAERFAGRFVVVAEEAGRPVGFAELEPNGHIDRVYVSADHQGQEIGRAMLAAVVAEAQRRKLDRLFVEASITARPFFEAMGFKVLAPQVVACRGVEFVNYRMERML